MTVEELKEGKCSVERALLVVSGLQSEEEVAEYQRKLDYIQNDFEEMYSRYADLGDEVQTARTLFDYLWETKPHRYNSDFFLDKVIDNQLDGDWNKAVGDCVGLTSLYSVLGVRLGLDLAVLNGKMHPSDKSDHVLNVLTAEDGEIAIENTSPFGFDEKLNEFQRQNFKKYDLAFLVLSAYNSIGNAKCGLEDFKGAIRDYDQALELKPDCAFAFNNRGNAKSCLGDFKGAIVDYDRALELNPDNVSAFYNRGTAKQDLGDFKGAIVDYDRALELNPDCAFAFNNRGIAKSCLGDFKGAIVDYTRALELNPDNENAKFNRELALNRLRILQAAV